MQTNYSANLIYGKESQKKNKNMKWSQISNTFEFQNVSMNIM